MLIAYDIANDRRRDRIAVALQEYGERVQFSVFLVDGRPATFVRLRAALAGLIDPAADTMLFCDLGPRDTDAARAITQIGTRRRLVGDEDSLIV